MKGVIKLHVLVLSLMSSTSVAASPCQPGQRTYTLRITVDDHMRLFIDGSETKNLPNAKIHNVADSVQIPCSAKVIAIHGRNLERAERAGILASSDGNSILTDASWKCTNVSYPGWEAVDYNNSFWPFANVYARNIGYTNKGVYYWHVPDISSYARWIWLRQWNGRQDSTYEEMDSEIFCRKNLIASESISIERKIISPEANTSSCEQRQSFTLIITADNSIRSLYIDGVKVVALPNADFYDEPDKVNIPWGVKVIAVHARNFPNRQRGGILASSDRDYVMTDASWKCTNVSYYGWQKVDYNDSFWANAIPYAINDKFGGLHKGSNYDATWGISEKSYWIWLRQWNGQHDFSYKEMDMEVYCRKTLAPDDLCGCKTFSLAEVEKEESTPTVPIIVVLGALLGVSIVANLILFSAICTRKKTSSGAVKGTTLNVSSACNDGDPQRIDQVMYQVLSDQQHCQDRQDNYEILKAPKTR